MLDLFLAGAAWFLTLMDHAPIDDGGRFSEIGESAPPRAGLEAGAGERLADVASALHRDDASTPNASIGV